MSSHDPTRRCYTDVNSGFSFLNGVLPTPETLVIAYRDGGRVVLSERGSDTENWISASETIDLEAHR